MSQLNLEITDDDIKTLESLDGLNFDAQRSEILKSLEAIDVQACPGSGKTTLIASKLKLLSQKWPYKNQGICVLSHTNVAKNEIIQKITTSNMGGIRSLLSYPHFIGTIQEFMNRYLGIPYLRSQGIDINLIDTEKCVELIHSRLNNKTRTYIEKKRSQFKNNVLFNFNLKISDNEIDIEVPTFSSPSTSQSYKNLKETREQLIQEGYFFYRDFYVFSEMMLITCPNLSEFLQTRFPLVFIDEMQDTQKFQDELLQKIFPLSSKCTSVQRFGDPDQAIFNGINNEVPNDSYNKKSRTDMTFVIDKSHRFDTSICEKIKRLSFNEINLDTDIKKNNRHPSTCNEFKHTVFIFNENTINNVIPEYAKLVAKQFDDTSRNSSILVKAVGAVGNEIDPAEAHLKIGHYWSTFNKTKSKRNFNADSLVEAVYFLHRHGEKDWAENYKLLSESVLKLIKLASIKDDEGKNINSTTLKKLLIERKKWYTYRRILFWLMKPNILLTEKNWNRICVALTKILNLPLSNEVSAYLTYSSNVAHQSPDDNVMQNSPIVQGIKIELSTIHGVKGETHDATLVLETKNYCYDIEAMMPYLTHDLPNDEHMNRQLRESPHARASFKPNQKFMRQLYVAMSRPRHLLCIAIHEDRITEEQKTSMISKGWAIFPINSDSS
ncbi:TPA: UvrD-helicase domain-containing protein [Legionella pneumophila]|nr:UvrD-helicase domain-containing protein [Legionella pneumophila]